MKLAKFSTKAITCALVVAVFVVSVCALLGATGCGALTRLVANRIADDTIKRVDGVEKNVEKLGEKIEAVVDQVEAKVTAAVKTPIVGIMVTLVLGAALVVLCAFKWPSLVDEVIIGTVALAGVLHVWAYREPILWTALAVAVGLAAWKLLRKYVLPQA